MPYIDHTNLETGKREKVFAGAFHYFLNEQSAPHEIPPLQLAEVFPPLSDQAQNRITASNSVRSLEFWKEPDENVRIIVAASPSDFLHFTGEIQSTYPGAQVREIEEGQPTWIEKIRSLWDEKSFIHFIDFEQSHSLPFLLFDTTQPQTLVEKIIHTLVGRAGWVQICWSHWVWSALAEQAHEQWNRVVAEIEEGVEVVVGTESGKFPGGWTLPIGFKKQKVAHPAEGSSVHANGKMISKQYSEKMHSLPLIVSVRGVILSKERALDLTDVFAGLRPEFDVIYPYSYDSSLMLRWLRARAIPDPAPFLQSHAAGGFLKDWGKGRELVPVFCLTPEELPLFVHLPRSHSLSKFVHFVRSTGIPEFVQAEGAEEKEGVVIAE